MLGPFVHVSVHGQDENYGEDEGKDDVETANHAQRDNIITAQSHGLYLGWGFPVIGSLFGQLCI